MEFQVFYENLRRLVDNELETERINLTLLQLNFQSGDSFSVRQNNTFERLDRPFEIHDGVVLPVREYRFSHVGIEGRTASQRKVSGNVGFDRGQFWSGNGASINAGISIRPVPGVTVSADLRHVDVDLPEGAFTTDLARVSGAWQASPWVSVTGNVQYDTVSEVVGLFTRLRWILTPGSDFYLVYTQNWQYEPLALRDRFVTLSRGATTKINYTHRF
jgi:hypothetical protein